MKFPKDFDHFEKLSSRFGEVKEDLFFWVNCLTTANGNADAAHPSFRADWLSAKSIAWGGVIHAFQHDSRFQEQNFDQSRYCDFTTLNLPDYDRVLLGYLFMLQLAGFSDGHPAREGVDEYLVKTQAVQSLLSRRMDEFEAVSGSDVLDKYFDRLVAATLLINAAASKCDPSECGNIRVSVNSENLDR